MSKKDARKRDIMEKKDPCLYQFSKAIFFFALAVCFAPCSADEISNLDLRLRAIRYAATNVHPELAKRESECLNLIPDHNAPSDKGKIYAAMAFIYSDRGYGPDDEPNMAAQAFRYSMKALEYPLDPLTACYMYARGADALLAQYRSDPNKPFVEAREQAIDLCLKGLKLALDNNAPKEYPNAPAAFTSINIALGTPLQRIIKLHNRQIEAREKWLYETEFSGLRQALFKRCILLYPHKPHDHEIFREKAQKILKGHDQTAAELITALEAQNAKQKSE